MDLRFFKEIPFFSHLDEERVKIISEAFKPKKFKKDDVIMSQGDEADGMYVIVFGEVEVRIEDKKVTDLKGNDFFGEIALVTNEPRTATLMAKSDDLLTLFLSRETFDQIKHELNEDAKREILQRIIENYEGW